MDEKRKAAENTGIVLQWFEELEFVIQHHGILSEDIWNMDETGFRFTFANSEFVVTREGNRRSWNRSARLFENRESATVIEASSASANVCPPFVIFKGKSLLASWYEAAISSEKDMKIGVSSTGYANDVRCLDWIKHFEKTTRGFRRGQYVLLLLDGFGSHHAIEFLKFCSEHDIIPLDFPPHSTHFLQPLDVGFFQPLKHYYSKATVYEHANRQHQITKQAFLRSLHKAREKAYSEHNIKSAFKKAGIVPLNSQAITEGFDHCPSIPERAPERERGKLAL